MFVHAWYTIKIDKYVGFVFGLAGNFDAITLVTGTMPIKNLVAGHVSTLLEFPNQKCLGVFVLPLDRMLIH